MWYLQRFTSEKKKSRKALPRLIQLCNEPRRLPVDAARTANLSVVWSKIWSRWQCSMHQFNLQNTTTVHVSSRTGRCDLALTKSVHPVQPLLCRQLCFPSWWSTCANQGFFFQHSSRQPRQSKVFCLRDVGFGPMQVIFWWKKAKPATCCSCGF